MLRFIATIAFIVIASTPLCADWPQFRGPTQQGISEGKGLPIEWGPQKNVVWKVPVPGKGWSSPIVAEGKIFLTTAVSQSEGSKPDLSLRTLCLDSSSGRTIWDREVFRHPGNAIPGGHSKNSQASPTPVTANEKVYVHFGHLGTARLNAADGAIDWVNTELGYSPVHGNGGSPVLFENKLIFAIDGSDRQEVVALAAETGKIVWRTPRNTKSDKQFSFGTPLLWQKNGTTEVVTQGSNVVMSLDPATGTELWRVAFKGYSVVPRPVAADGMIYLSTGYDNGKVLALKPTGTGDITSSAVAWQAAKNAPYNPSMICMDGLLYAVSDAGIASCWDAQTGEVIWSERVPEKYSASLLYAEGRLYLQSEEGTGTVLKAGRTFETLATNKLGERSLASYAVDGSALIIRTEKNLYRIENK
jgi:outer membrane protein assembly factor BamB